MPGLIRDETYSASSCNSSASTVERATSAPRASTSEPSLTAAQKYEGKTTIEAFFWRFGDLAQAGAIYAGLHWLNFGIQQFALINMVLSMLWLMVARQLARGYRNKEQAVSLNHPPRLLRRPRKRALPVGQPFDFSLPLDTFIDPDQGDVLTFTSTPKGLDEPADFVVTVVRQRD